MSDEQRAEWEAFVRDAHGKGNCESSGLDALTCYRSICDCFETEEGARDIVGGYCQCQICAFRPERGH